VASSQRSMLWAWWSWGALHFQVGRAYISPAMVPGFIEPCLPSDAVMTKLAASLLGVILFAGLALADPRPGTCSGELSRLPEGEWVIRMGREGICTFRGEDVKIKVLAVCSEGQGCEVTGLVGDCQDPECTEIRRVRSVRRVRSMQRPTGGR
jgi:hypothetical protein